MSFIACSGSCKYQKDGYCGLEDVSAWNGPAQPGGCMYFVKSDGFSSLPTQLTQQNSSDGLSNVFDGQEL